MVEVQQLWALCGLELRALEASGVLGCSSPLIFKAPDHVRRVLLRALLFIYSAADLSLGLEGCGRPEAASGPAFSSAVDASLSVTFFPGDRTLLLTKRLVLRRPTAFVPDSRGCDSHDWNRKRVGNAATT